MNKVLSNTAIIVCPCKEHLNVRFCQIKSRLYSAAFNNIRWQWAADTIGCTVLASYSRCMQLCTVSQDSFQDIHCTEHHSLQDANTSQHILPQGIMTHSGQIAGQQCCQWQHCQCFVTKTCFAMAVLLRAIDTNMQGDYQVDNLNQAKPSQPYTILSVNEDQHSPIELEMSSLQE